MEKLNISNGLRNYSMVAVSWPSLALSSTNSNSINSDLLYFNYNTRGKNGQVLNTSVYDLRTQWKS